MFAATDWANLTVAGAFVLGAVLGALATIRLARALLGLFARAPTSRRPRGDDEPNG